MDGLLSPLVGDPAGGGASASGADTAAGVSEGGVPPSATNKSIRRRRSNPLETNALDAHLFQDMEDALTFNCALSSTFHAVGDPLRFGMGTPAEVSR